MRRLACTLLVAAVAAPAAAHAAPPAEEQPAPPPADPSAPSECLGRDADGWVRPVDCDTGQPLVLAPMPASPVQDDEAARAERASQDKTARKVRPDDKILAEPPADEDDDSDLTDLPCIIVPHPGCGTQPHVEAGMGWGESHSYVGWQWSYRGWIEAGVLAGLHRNYQLGPVFELGFDTGRVNSGFTASTKLKSRYWIAGWYIALDTALGAAFEHFTFDGGTENGTRYGPTADLAFTVLGALGPYVSYSQLGDPGGLAKWESRILVGFRASLGGWGLLLWPFGEAFKGPIIL